MHLLSITYLKNKFNHLKSNRMKAFINKLIALFTAFFSSIAKMFASAKEFTELVHDVSVDLKEQSKQEKIENQYKQIQKINNMSILTARPEGMSFEDYKRHLKAQKQWIKQRKQGFLVYRSSVILTDPDDRKIKRKQTFHPFVGVASSLKPV